MGVLLLVNGCRIVAITDETAVIEQHRVHGWPTRASRLKLTAWRFGVCRERG
jgi:hypothetical protein